MSLLLLPGALLPGLHAQEKLAPQTLPASVRPDASSFTNPIVQNAADPWVVYRKGFYYMTRTVGWGVAIRKSPTLAGLATAKEFPVWRGGGPGFEEYKHHVWAPELHHVRGKWYVYYTATLAGSGPNSDPGRRIFCLESKTDDPLGAYTFKGKVAVPDPAEDSYAIDGTLFERPSDKKLFFLWSGREQAKSGPQNIYIAPMSNPWTISGPRVRLSTPTLPWEVHGWKVNEGPEVLTRNGKTFIIYSASGGTTRYYSLGMLTNTDGDLLNPASWTKSDHPVFEGYESPAGNIYGVGHNGFFRSPDGKEDWIIYHGKDINNNTWGERHARAQRFTWNADGSPNFGKPLLSGASVSVPSGER